MRGSAISLRRDASLVKGDGTRINGALSMQWLESTGVNLQQTHCHADGSDVVHGGVDVFAGGHHGAHGGENVASGVLASHGKFWRVAVCCVTDLQAVEVQLRQLYGTGDGQLCQALLTTEYQAWKRSVSLELRNESCASPPETSGPPGSGPPGSGPPGSGSPGSGSLVSSSLDSSSLDSSALGNGMRRRFSAQTVEDWSLRPRPLLRTIEAFLPQYHLLYACQSVDIYRILPLVPTFRAGKRERPESAKDAYV
jgi:hypothetical protein